MKTIEVTARNVYGEVKLYPRNSAAHALAEIAGTKTLTVRIIKLACREFGFDHVIFADDALANAVSKLFESEG